MGGPCFVDGERGPAATDNFAIKPFTINGKTWQSVEQFFQAYKYADPAMVDKFHQVLPKSDNSVEYGLLCASMGQERHPSFRPNWEQIKAESMYRAKRAQIAQNPDFKEQLLSTIGKDIVHPDRAPFWAEWNARMIQRIRQELRPEGERDTALLDSCLQAYKDIMRGDAHLADCPELVDYP